MSLLHSRYSKFNQKLTISTLPWRTKRHHDSMMSVPNSRFLRRQCSRRALIYHSHHRNGGKHWTSYEIMTVPQEETIDNNCHEDISSDSRTTALERYFRTVPSLTVIAEAISS